MTLSIFFADPLTQTRLGALPLSKFSFNDPLGTPGSFTGVVPIGTDTNIDQVRRLTKRDGSAIYVMDEDTYIWGGPISTPPVWDPNASTVTFSAAKWKSYLWSLFYPNGYKSGATLQDQFTIMSDMLNQGLGTQAYGVPDIRNTTDLSGVTRQNVMYQNFSNVGESMEQFANRDNGFEWDLLVRNNQVNGDPQVYLQKWKTERGYGQNLSLSFIADPDASAAVSNILTYAPDQPDTYANRVWAIGAGQSPDQAFSSDEDPALADGFMLLRESTRSFSQTTIAATLFEYARGERVSKQTELGGMSVDIDPDSYALRDYDTGARTRLTIRDAWYDLELPSARIVDRAVFWDRDNGFGVTLALDLDDSVAPSEEG